MVHGGKEIKEMMKRIKLKILELLTDPNTNLSFMRIIKGSETSIWELIISRKWARKFMICLIMWRTQIENPSLKKSVNLQKDLNLVLYQPNTKKSTLILQPVNWSINNKIIKKIALRSMKETKTTNLINRKIINTQDRILRLFKKWENIKSIEGRKFKKIADKNNIKNMNIALIVIKLGKLKVCKIK